jgi:Domain of unknown function (DUF6542)
VAIVAAGAALGALMTAMTGGQPGTLLGVFLIAGTLAAALAVRPGAAHLIVPAPPLAYLAGATAAGLFVMPAGTMSRTGLAVSVLQWMAHGFLEMLIATGAALALTVIRRRVMLRAPGVRAR